MNNLTHRVKNTIHVNRNWLFHNLRLHNKEINAIVLSKVLSMFAIYPGDSHTYSIISGENDNVNACGNASVRH